MAGAKRSGKSSSKSVQFYLRLAVVVAIGILFTLGFGLTLTKKSQTAERKASTSTGVHSSSSEEQGALKTALAEAGLAAKSADNSDKKDKFGDEVPPSQVDAIDSEDQLASDEDTTVGNEQQTALAKQEELQFRRSVVRAASSWRTSLGELAFGAFYFNPNRTSDFFVLRCFEESKTMESDPVWKVLSEVGKSLVPAHNNFNWASIKGHPYFVDRDSRFLVEALTEVGINTKRSWGKKPLKGDAIFDFRLLFCHCIGDTCSSFCHSPDGLARLQPYQRVNRIPGLRNTLWLKHRFCLTTSEVTREFKETLSPAALKNWGFLFDCFILPTHMKAARQVQAKEEQEGGITQRWIIKPTHRGEGAGIQLMESMKEVIDFYVEAQTPGSSTSISNSMKESYRRLPAVVQPYLSSNYLIDGKKFDCRLYVLVTSISPLRAYAYTRGLVRFAADKYEDTTQDNEGEDKSKMKKTQFLTNTSVGKSKQSVATLTWPLGDLRKYWRRRGVNDEKVMRRVYRSIALMLMGGEPNFLKVQDGLAKNTTHGPISSASFFQLLGVDVIFDANLMPKIIEVNGEPSMLNSDAWFTNTHYDETKRKLSRDIIRVLTFKAKTKSQLQTNVHSAKRALYTGLDFLKKIVGVASVDCDDEMRRVDGSFPSGTFKMVDNADVSPSPPAYTSTGRSEPPLFCLNDEEMAYLLRAHL
eukprot:CAMPEP_0113902756 /NCGR_PEP_ID=MMETSP0780_2-20120614/22042_1 /TAXON_ID=652834 /ORGANISM="Palpitomonas bilix" /LENGTH=696 /DNA_ID=CAMNT_0000895627 /DNA_START=144 /DNA_END=2230 /DNA_ORIENTATION=- /assembly_acc=CAM_ASM_000599